MTDPDQNADVKKGWLPVAGEGEDLCPTCGGTGEQEGARCPECGGSGRVRVEIAGG